MALSFSPSMCSGNAIPYPTVPGAEILSLQSTLVSNYSQFVHEGYYLNHHSVDVTNVSFCNVTVAYTHPGENDTVHVKVYLPLDGWNERMQAIGGSGWTAGFSSVSAPAMIGAVGQGYVAVTTDGGHYSDLTGDPSSWVLRSNGELNWHALQDFASVTLNDAAIIGKSLAESVYGRAPKYSYWSGCSQGGRQGLMLAQRYPTAFNGIVASAPAINIDRFMVTDYWPQLIMTLQDEYPYPCELNALTAAAIAACDSNDGVIDGLLSDPDSCHFDPHALVGTTFNCSDTGAEQKISKIAADVASAAWMGARSTNGSFLWYGINRDAILSGNGLDTIGPANTECDKNGTCVAAPPSLLTDWIRVFVEKNPDFPLSNMTHEEFDQIFEKSVREFDAIAGTNDPDLSAFRDAGGKMLTFHGLADQIIPPNGTRQYYNAVTAKDPNVHSYYRLFESPGLAHCYSASGGHPADIFDKLVAWVEQGIAPETLTANYTTENGTVNHRILCPYPQKAVYDGVGDPTAAESFYCS